MAHPDGLSHRTIKLATATPAQAIDAIIVNFNHDLFDVVATRAPYWFIYPWRIEHD